MVSLTVFFQDLAKRLVANHPGPSQSSVGLDLGAEAIKLVKLKCTPQGFEVVDSLIQELSASASGQSADPVGWLRSALDAFKAREVSLAISGPEVVVRAVRLPLIPRGEMQEAVKWQVKDELPFSVQDAVIDFTVLGEVWEKDLRKQDVLVAAAPLSLVRAYCDSVRKAGASVISVRPSATAAWWAIAQLLPELRKGSLAILDCGSSETRVTIVKDAHVRLVRGLAGGSKRFSEALMGVVAGERGEVTIDLAKAEAFKRRYGVLTETAAGSTEEGVSLFQLASLMRPVLEGLVTELSRLLSFYQVQVEEAGVGRIFLCGGGANIKALATFLADGLGVPVEIWNPLIRMPSQQHLEPERIAESGPRLAIAVGAAMAAGQPLNLLPPELRQLQQLAQWRAVGWHLVRRIGPVLAVLYILFAGSLGFTQWQINQQQELWTAVEPTYQRYQQMAAGQRRAQATLLRVQQLLDIQPVWDGLLKEVGSLLPPSLVAEEMSVTLSAEDASWHFHLKGHGTNGNTDFHGGLSQFIAALKRSPFFVKVEMVRSEMRTTASGSSDVEVEGILK